MQNPSEFSRPAWTAPVYLAAVPLAALLTVLLFLRHVHWHKGLFTAVNNSG